MIARAFPHRHLLGISDLSAQDIMQVIDLASAMRSIGERQIKKVPTLRGRTIINLFLENSTRTRTSFEIAGKRMSADTINISGSGSSAGKGETMLDTARNLMAMNPDLIVIRHSASGAPAMIAKHVQCAVVNAGDGTHEHPTQALLDCATILRHKSAPRQDASSASSTMAGFEIAIIGDIDHSRVARSNILAMTKLGASLRLCGPETLIPRDVDSMSDVAGQVRVCHKIDEALEGADVVMMLRIQSERLGDFAPRFAGTREYSRYYGLNLKRLAGAKNDAIVMHPGPINRGVEMMSNIADGPRSVILDQVTSGVAVRMAVLYLLARQGELEELQKERA